MAEINKEQEVRLNRILSGQPTEEEKRNDIKASVHRLHSQLQHLNPFTSYDADLSYALQVYIRSEGVVR